MTAVFQTAVSVSGSWYCAYWLTGSDSLGCQYGAEPSLMLLVTPTFTCYNRSNVHSEKLSLKYFCLCILLRYFSVSLFSAILTYTTADANYYFLLHYYAILFDRYSTNCFGEQLDIVHTKRLPVILIKVGPI